MFYSLEKKNLKSANMRTCVRACVRACGCARAFVRVLYVLVLVHILRMCACVFLVVGVGVDVCRVDSV